MDSVDIAHALAPINDSERLLFRNLLPSLVHLDCQGEVRPALAESWSSDRDGRVWTFTLRGDTRLASGVLLSAAQVIRQWREEALTGNMSGIDSATALNDRQLQVFLSQPDSAPRILAAPVFAVVDSVEPAGTDNERILRMRARDNGRAIEFHLSPNGDARDELDRGADLLVTRSTALTEYAEGRNGFATLALPWSRTYLLVQPSQAEPLEFNGAEAEGPALARDAVQADARAAAPLAWLDQAGACARSSPSEVSAGGGRVAYVRGDDVARSLAERIVAVAGPAERLKTLALAAADFGRLLRQGSERAYIVSVPRQSLTPCRDGADLPAGARLRRLIETRAHAIIRKGAPPLLVDWDGTLRMAAP